MATTTQPHISAAEIPQPPTTGPKLKGFALASVLSALVLTLLLEARDQTIVGTALPHIVASLQGSDRYTWAVTAYTLGWCSLIPIVVLIPQFALTRIGAIARMQAIMRIAASKAEGDPYGETGKRRPCRSGQMMITR